MNKRLVKGLSVCMMLGLCAVAAIADDVVNADTAAPAATPSVAARTDCAAVKAELADLQMIVEPTVAQADRKKLLQNTYRRDCAARATGRRANNRGAGVVPTLPVAAPVANPVPDAAPMPPVAPTPSPVADTPASVTDTLAGLAAQKQKLCQQLADEIESLQAADNADTEKLATMKSQYDTDCVTPQDTPSADDAPQATDEPDVTESKPVENAGPSDEDIIAFLDAGLCLDGTKPNKFGCCAGERFKDLGNSVFACCPEAGGDCFPPITPIE